MKDILGYIATYWREVDKRALVICSLFTGILIYFNYAHGLELMLTSPGLWPLPAFTGHVVLFIIAFVIPHLVVQFSKKINEAMRTGLVVCLLLAPMIFALKMSIETQLSIGSSLHWMDYWNQILYWPVRLLIMLLLLVITWRIFHRDEGFYGLNKSSVNYRPYIIMLVIMVPLIALASTQPDFLRTYPKLHNVLPLPPGAEPSWWYKLLFELSYGSDFVSIELFFRGFLVIGIAKWVGKDAILPMACFYCTIHFGKPLGECISSYFGGLLLGIVSYHTRSIYGGLMVHLGIAWLMEAGGYIGQALKG